MAFQEVKVCLLGDSGVGKSSTVQRFVHNYFNPSSESTIGASFMTKTMSLSGFNYKFNIWDTAGQERYRALAPMYYRGAGAAIIVYDITSYPSFKSVKLWARELQLHGPPNIILAIAGNKCDLEDRREVSYDEAKKYAEDIGALFAETSARIAVNINELFENICQRIPKQANPVVNQLKLKNDIKSDKKCC